MQAEQVRNLLQELQVLFGFHLHFQFHGYTDDTSFIILGFPNAPAGLATLMGRMSDAPLSMLMASSTPMFPNEGASTGWLP